MVVRFKYSEMYLMYYLNDEGEQIYTLQVRVNCAQNIWYHAILCRLNLYVYVNML